jgi:hypothetical protein
VTAKSPFQDWSEADDLSFVMPGLVPGIHVFRCVAIKTWVAGINPAMTTNMNVSGQPKSALNRARNCFSARPADHGVT